MPLIYLVRHGRVADPPADPHDPELGAQGLAQAEAVAQELHARLKAPLPILTSPMLRCRQTAAPLARLWGVSPVVEPRLIEVPTPPGAKQNRAEWLGRLLASSWPAMLGDEPALLDHWRREVRAAILDCHCDTLAFTHFVPINVIAGLALGQDRVSCFRPDNASVTVVETSASGIRLMERGREVGTQVL